MQHPTSEMLWDPTVLERVAGAGPFQAGEDATDGERALFDLVAGVVELLPPREREVLEALYWERLSQRALARRWGCSQKWVWVVKGMALRRLKSVLLAVRDS